jgi:hypothetical protein
VPERFSPGARVLVRLDDPRVHTRAPRYVRGRRGTVVEVHGAHPLPDAVVAGSGPATEPVYAVAFDGADLWGEGDHRVIVNLWETYLEED